MLSMIQTWWNLDVRSHIDDYMKHTISDMHPPHTHSHQKHKGKCINSKTFDNVEQMRS